MTPLEDLLLLDAPLRPSGRAGLPAVISKHLPREERLHAGHCWDKASVLLALPSAVFLVCLGWALSVRGCVGEITLGAASCRRGVPWGQRGLGVRPTNALRRGIHDSLCFDALAVHVVIFTLRRMCVKCSLLQGGAGNKGTVIDCGRRTPEVWRWGAPEALLLGAPDRRPFMFSSDSRGAPRGRIPTEERGVL